MRGELEIPKGAKVLLSEPAIVMEVTEDTYLFGNPPILSQNEYEKTIDQELKNLSLTGEKNANTIQRKLGNFLKVSNKNEKYAEDESQIIFVPKKNKKINKFFQNDEKHRLIPQVLLKKGELVLARPFEQLNPFTHNQELLNPFAYEVARYENASEKKNNMPETGRGVKILNIGYVFQSCVKTLKKQENYQPFKQDIFPDEFTKVDIEDVSQNTLGDCFLLAALISILNKYGGQKYLRQIMKQFDDYTIVKLNDPRNGSEIYLKVNNSFYYENNDKETIKHKVPAIHMLEKAYAGLGFILDKDKQVQFMHASFRAMYGSGGKTALAFKILLGEDAIETQIHQKFDSTKQSIHPWNYQLCMHAASLADILSCIQDDQQMLQEQKAKWQKEFEKLNEPVRTCFKTLDNFLMWGTYLNKLQAENKDQYQTLLDWISAADDLQELLTSDQALELVTKLENEKKPNSPANLLAAIFKQYVLSPYLDKVTQTYAYRYMGATEDRQYTVTQKKVFNDVEKNLKADYLLTASTQSKFDKDVPGLRNAHAYAVLDVKRTLINDKAHWFLKLRNPWGIVGRAYNWDKANQVDFIQEEKEFGTFWIELSDFTRYFKSYTTCDPHNKFLLAKVDTLLNDYKSTIQQFKP